MTGEQLDGDLRKGISHFDASPTQKLSQSAVSPQEPILDQHAYGCCGHGFGIAPEMPDVLGGSINARTDLADSDDSLVEGAIVETSTQGREVVSSCDFD